MSPFVLLLYIYGVLLILGGLIGYLKAKSVPSLVAGGICGVIALLLGYYYSTFHFAPHAAFLLALLLIFMMGRRYLNSRKVMPAGLIVILSIIVAIAQIYVIFSTLP
jgi:uncharacterized membrane protein (UPF0136 family)